MQTMTGYVCHSAFGLAFAFGLAASAVVDAAADESFPSQMPSRLIECEGGKACDGIWTFGDNGGKAQWANGARADLSIERFDRERIIIHRDDTSNPGFTAIYVGTLSGSRMSGTVTWSWPGHWSENVTGIWSATIDNSNGEVLAAPRTKSVVTVAQYKATPKAAHAPTHSRLPRAAASGKAHAVVSEAAPVSDGVAALEAHFRHVWSSDQCVQQRQSWQDYEGWLSQFYGGPNGWTANIGAVTEHISDAAVRKKRAAELNALGIRVAGEWAKDNACRRIRTSNGFFNADEAGKPALSDFRDQLEAAAAADKGDGVRLGQAIRQIGSEVDAALANQ